MVWAPTGNPLVFVRAMMLLYLMNASCAVDSTHVITASSTASCWAIICTSFFSVERRALLSTCRRVCSFVRDLSPTPANASSNAGSSSPRSPWIINRTRILIRSAGCRINSNSWWRGAFFHSFFHFLLRSMCLRIFFFKHNLLICLCLLLNALERLPWWFS